MTTQWIRMDPANVTVHGRTYGLRWKGGIPQFLVRSHNFGWFCFVFSRNYAGFLLEDDSEDQ